MSIWSWDKLSPCCDCEDDYMKHNWDEAPHRVEGSPAAFVFNPRDARVEVAAASVSPTDDQPPPRQEGEAVAIPWLRQVRDGAGVGGREDFDVGEDVMVAIPAAHQDLP